jgi:hypothetical protein
MHGEFAATTQRKAVHRRNDRVGAIREDLPELADAECKPVTWPHRRHFLQVSAGGKCAFISCDNDAPYVGVVGEVPESGNQRLASRHIEGVQGFWPVKLHESDVVGWPFNEDE